MTTSIYQSTRLQRNELMRQNLEQGTLQGMAPHPRENNKIENFFDKKNSVLTSYNKQIENLSSIERLKYEYGVEKNVVLSRDNVEKNRPLLEKYIEYFSTYPDSE